MNKLTLRTLTVLLATVLATVPPFLSAREQLRDEYVVKAAFLYNFAKYVKWPAEALASPDTPISLCIVEPDPFGQPLEELKKKPILGHPVEIIRIDEIKGDLNCHVLFLSKKSAYKTNKLLDITQSHPVLTVGDIEGFAEQGGMINFYIYNEKVRFEINVNAIKNAGLEISARLLQVARIVNTVDKERK